MLYFFAVCFSKILNIVTKLIIFTLVGLKDLTGSAIKYITETNKNIKY